MRRCAFMNDPEMLVPCCKMLCCLCRFRLNLPRLSIIELEKMNEPVMPEIREKDGSLFGFPTLEMSRGSVEI